MSCPAPAEAVGRSEILSHSPTQCLIRLLTRSIEIAKMGALFASIGDGARTGLTKITPGTLYPSWHGSIPFLRLRRTNRGARPWNTSARLMDA